MIIDQSISIFYKWMIIVDELKRRNCISSVVVVFVSETLSSKLDTKHPSLAIADQIDFRIFRYDWSRRSYIKSGSLNRFYTRFTVARALVDRIPLFIRIKPMIRGVVTRMLRPFELICYLICERQPIITIRQEAIVFSDPCVIGYLAERNIDIEDGVCIHCLPHGDNVSSGESSAEYKAALKKLGTRTDLNVYALTDNEATRLCVKYALAKDSVTSVRVGQVKTWQKFPSMVTGLLFFSKPTRFHTSDKTKASLIKACERVTRRYSLDFFVQLHPAERKGDFQALINESSKRNVIFVNDLDDVLVNHCVICVSMSVSTAAEAAVRNIPTVMFATREQRQTWTWGLQNTSDLNLCPAENDYPRIVFPADSVLATESSLDAIWGMIAIKKGEKLSSTFAKTMTDTRPLLADVLTKYF